MMMPLLPDALAADAAAAVDAVAAIAVEFGRNDLADRLVVAAARVRRPATIVCVVGEFKQGKSSLINAMLGLDVCPVDDDIATSATTLLRYGAEPSVVVRRRLDDGVVVERVDPATLADWVTEGGNPDNSRSIERVDIMLPHPLLANGLVIVDTPGMGGLGAGHAAATLSFLPFADGLIFVSDASSELSGPEVEFLDSATGLCPNVVFALAKIDLYPSWRRIETINARLLHDQADAPVVVPVSSVLTPTGSEPPDEKLVEMSGVAALLARIESQIVSPAKAVAAQRALHEALGAVRQMKSALETELDVLDNPSNLAEIVARLTESTAHLELLRGPGARWSIVVADRLSDLSSNTGHQFRGAMRSVSRDIEGGIELLKTSDDWDQLARQLQTSVADAVTKVFVEIERGAQSTRQAVVDLIGEDSGDDLSEPTRSVQVELASLWTTRAIDPLGKRGTRQLSSALVGLRGAQGGIMMFGMMATFLPAGAAALLMSNPITISIGAAFAGVQLADARKRKIAQRRQQARSNVRQFLDDVQFAVGNEIGDALREVQRSIRDEFTGRISELLRTYAETAQTAKRAATEHGEFAQQHIVALHASLERLSLAERSLARSSAE